MSAFRTNVPVKGLGGMSLSVWGRLPPPSSLSHTVWMHVPPVLIHTGKGGGVRWTSEKVRGALVHQKGWNLKIWESPVELSVGRKRGGRATSYDGEKACSSINYPILSDRESGPSVRCRISAGTLKVNIVCELDWKISKKTRSNSF
jgi:hypothetical protein